MRLKTDDRSTCARRSHLDASILEPDRLVSTRSGLTLKQQEALAAKMAADLAERKATRGRKRA